MNNGIISIKVISRSSWRRITAKHGSELRSGTTPPPTPLFFLFYPVTFTTQQAMVNKTNLFLLRKTRQGSVFGILPACCSFVDG